MQRVLFAFILVSAGALLAAPKPPAQALDPRGRAHIPIGVANSLDALKTFVEAEGNFSPGFGSYGVYFWLWHAADQKLYAPTMEGVPCERGLGTNGWLVPWSQWQAGDMGVKTEICQVSRPSPAGEVMVVGVRVHLVNRANASRTASLYVALRPLGAAGWKIKTVGCSQVGDTLAVDHMPAIVGSERSQRFGALTNDTIGDLARTNGNFTSTYAESPEGEASGALVYDVELAPGASRTFNFICPVLPQRRVRPHQWDGKSSWAQFDEAVPNPAEGGVLQPYPGLAYYRRLKADTLFAEAQAYWANLAGRTRLNLPDRRWAECFAAIVAHSALCLNEGAPDVAVVNYNVFNRDGVYMANIFQKAGHFELAVAAIDYFLGHPFNGRVQPEADNPGQILWIMGEHWMFTRDRQWLQRVYPAAQKIAAMIRYYRTTPGPHWVWDTSLDFGDALPADRRKELKPGACDGFHPEYTEAFDIAGLKGAVMLAEAVGGEADAKAWKALANDLFVRYDQRFGARLAKDYGSYCVLWPTRLYPLEQGPAHQKFAGVGLQKPTSWRYFPLATAHQGLLAGNRSAGWETLHVHLDHEQMRGWYAFDEGGPSGVGGWNHVRTTWPRGKESVAMPHGWAIAEVILLLRDCLICEDGDRLRLLGGVPPAWFTHPAGMEWSALPTHFGKCDLRYRYAEGVATVRVSGVTPPGGIVLRLPPELAPELTVGGKSVPACAPGEFLLPRESEIQIRFKGK